MGKRMIGSLIAVFALAGLFSATSAHARDEPLNDNSAGIVAKFVASQHERNSSKILTAEWDTVRLTLEGHRLREGLRRHCALYDCGKWHRAYRGGAMLGFDILGPLQLGLRYGVSRDRRGNNRAAIVSDGTGGMSQRISLEIASDAAVLSAAAFDNAGWQQGDLQTLAARVSNGEQRAVRGVSAGFARRIDDRRNMWLNFSTEQTQSSGFGAETTAIVRLSTVF